MGRHPNTQLQSDWKSFGTDVFSYEVLEEKETDDVVDVAWELKQMEKAWLEKLQPFDDMGYNKRMK